MHVRTVLATVAVADFETSLGWYERFLGRPPDERPMDGLAQWHISETALFQVLQEPERAGRSIVGLSVADLGREVAALRGRGLTPEVEEKTSEKVLFAILIDPEGNKVGVLAEKGDGL